MFREKLFLKGGDRLERRPDTFSCVYVHMTGISACLHLPYIENMPQEKKIKNNPNVNYKAKCTNSKILPIVYDFKLI